MCARDWTAGLLMLLSSASATWAQLPIDTASAVDGRQPSAQGQPSQASPAGTAQTAKRAQAVDPGWHVEIAPVYVWVPIYIGNTTLPKFPEFPPPPGGGDRPSGDTGASLSGAYMAALRVENDRWMARGNFVWAGLSGDRQAPIVELSVDVFYGEFFSGVRVVDYLWIEGGVRRLAVDVKATVLDYPEVSRKPGLWDPQIGASYRRPLGKHWFLALHGDAGGLGVGSDVDYCLNAVLDWRFSKHGGMAFGYQALYFRFSDTVLDSTRLERTLTLGTGLNGPILGFKLLF